MGWASLPLLCSVAFVAFGGCVYDSEQRCGKHQVLLTENDTEFCACDPRSAATEEGCVPCGEHEVPGPNGCLCAPGFSRSNDDEVCVACGPNEMAGTDGCECTSGYARASADAECEPCGTDETIPCASGAQGAACDPAQNPCTDSTHDYCHVAEGRAGYCTVDGCTEGGDCTGGYGCDAGGVCLKPPEGMGSACASPADCAGTEATFCDVVVTRTCLVEGCAVDGDDCFPGYVCCDLSAFGLPTTICAQGSCL